MTRDDLEHKYWRQIDAALKTYQDTEGDLVAAVLSALEFKLPLGEEA